jgi:Tol biopolymer transport system component/DNA-binding winged helix-turn-helix (wHTH) protein
MSLSRSSINSQQTFTADNSNNGLTYEFEHFRLDAGHLMLYRQGEAVPLRPKVVETLVALIERRGEVVSKDELMDRLWPEQVVEESNLSQSIYLLRKELGDGINGRPLIETFWKRGYRFNGEVRRSDDFELILGTRTRTLVLTDELETTESEIETSSVDRLGARLWKNSSQKIFLAAAALLAGASLLTVGGIRYWQSLPAEQTPQRAQSAPTAKMFRMTPDLNVNSVAISSDRHYLTYNLVEKGKHSLWVKDVRLESSSRIMPPVDNPYFDVTFSPDGGHIFYNTFQNNSPNRTIFRIPSNGGEPQSIATDAVGPITFSPDGGRIAFVRAWPGKSSLVTADSDGSGNELTLNSRTGTAVYESWGSNLSWSPDGSRIAICGARLDGNRYIYELIEVSVTDGKERIIVTPGWDYMDDVAWLSDGSGLVVRARETHASPWQIWHVSYPDGATRRITNDLNDYDGVSLSADRSLAVTKLVGNWNIWLGDVERPGQFKQITFGSTASDGAHGIAFTPDGQIIYTSPRDGNTDLWRIDPDGGAQLQLTKNAGEFNGDPVVSPDGNSIVFESSRSGSKEIWRMDSDGGNPQQLTDTGLADGPSFSPDGEWVYFTLYNDGKPMIARIPAAGGELAIVKEFEPPVFGGHVSPDAKLIALGFYDHLSAQPWKYGVLSIDSGERIAVFDSLRLVGGWQNDSKALIVIRPDRRNLWLQPIDGREHRQITAFEEGQIRLFAVSQDAKQVAVARGNPTAEAVLMTDILAGY